LANSKRWKKSLNRRKLVYDRFYQSASAKQKYLCFPYPGKILPIDLTEFQGKFICQKFVLMQPLFVGIEFSN
jgi:hypothetical protein